jgi:hypothetical protein
LDSFRESSPAFFEQLIDDLQLEMNCGGTWEEAERAIGQVR